MYDRGIGVDRNSNKSFDLYLQAANMGDVPAKREVGSHYYWGTGVEKNAEQAFFWRLNAAENGDSGAQNQVGHHYFYGEGVQQNLEKSLEWYLKAINNGHSSADEWIHVAEIYFYFNDYHNAAEYYHKYAKSYSDEGKDDLYEYFKIAERYYYGNKVTQKPQRSL